MSCAGFCYMHFLIMYRVIIPGELSLNSLISEQVISSSSAHLCFCAFNNSTKMKRERPKIYRNLRLKYYIYTSAYKYNNNNNDFI